MRVHINEVDVDVLAPGFQRLVLNFDLVVRAADKVGGSVAVLMYDTRVSAPPHHGTRTAQATTTQNAPESREETT